MLTKSTEICSSLLNSKIWPRSLPSPLLYKPGAKLGIKLSFDFFKDIKIGYSYSHISNNDWGTKNPGVNNETFSFTKSF